MRQLAGGPHVGLGQAARAAELTVVYVRKMCRGASATLTTVDRKRASMLSTMSSPRISEIYKPFWFA